MPLLFVFHDVSAHTIIGVDHSRVDGGSHLPACLINESRYLLKEGILSLYNFSHKST